MAVRPIRPEEEADWDAWMQRRHPLGNPQLSGHRIKCIAERGGKPVALASFSACAYHLADRPCPSGSSRQRVRKRRLL